MSRKSFYDKRKGPKVVQEVLLVFDTLIKAGLGIIAFLAMDSFSKLNHSINELNQSQKELSTRLGDVVTKMSTQAAYQDGLASRVAKLEDRIEQLRRLQ